MMIIADKNTKKLSFEFTDLQVENLKALIMDANIKGSAAVAIVELINILDNTIERNVNNDLHGEHHDTEGHSPDEPKENNDKSH